MKYCFVCRKNKISTNQDYCGKECKSSHELHGTKRYNKERRRFEVFNCYTQRCENAYSFTLEDGSVVVRYDSPQGAWVLDPFGE